MFVTKINVTDGCHVAANRDSEVDNDDDVVDDMADDVGGDVDGDVAGDVVDDMASDNDVDNDMASADVAFTARPILELGHSVGPFFSPHPLNRP